MKTLEIASSFIKLHHFPQADGSAAHPRGILWVNCCFVFFVKKEPSQSEKVSNPDIEPSCAFGVFPTWEVWEGPPVEVLGGTLPLERLAEGPWMSMGHV